MTQAGIDLLKSFEGLRLKAYKDSVGIWTIGYGHTGSVSPDMEITAGEAEELLKKDLESFEAGVQKLLTTPVTPNQFAAMVCFAYNCGLGNFKQSTLLRCVNKHNIAGAADEFLRWDKAAGIVLPGLTRRRKAERELFLSDDGYVVG